MELKNQVQMKIEEEMKRRSCNVGLSFEADTTSKNKRALPGYRRGRGRRNGFWEAQVTTLYVETLRGSSALPPRIHSLQV